MHRIVRQPAQAEPVKVSGEKAYIVLSRYTSGDWYVTMSPFKEVPVYKEIQTAINYAEDGEYVIEIDLPATDS